MPAGPFPYHTDSVLVHTAKCMDAMSGDPLGVWMAMTHDSGKLTTPHSLWPHHYGHEARGERLAAVWAQQLGLAGSYAHAGVFAARLHMRAGRYAGLRPSKKFDLLQEVAASGFFSSFWKMVDADTRSSLSEMARRDWQHICAVPYVSTTCPERLRQQGISLLRSTRHE